MPPLLLGTLPRAARHGLSCFALYALGTASNLTSKGRGSSGAGAGQLLQQTGSGSRLPVARQQRGLPQGAEEEEQGRDPFPPSVS